MPTAVDANGNPTTPAERELWEWLDNLAMESDRARREEGGYDDFDTNLEMYYGKHWPQVMPSFRPAIVINELRTLILSEASDLSDADLRIYVLKDPKNGGRDEEAERALRAVWAREQIDLKLIYACCWALILGTGFLRVLWDPDAHNGFGDVTVEVPDPKTVLPDPDATDDKRWMYVMYEHVLDLLEIKRLFPLNGNRVKPEDRYSVKDHNAQAPDKMSWANYSGPMTDDYTLVGKGTHGYKKARARVLDCFVKDDTVEEVVEEIKDVEGLPVLDEQGQPQLEVKRQAKYKNGRRIVGANGVILFDGDNPNPAGDFGTLRVILEPALGKFWSKGFVQQTQELQMAADKLMSAVVENGIRLNNGIVKATTNTGLDWESFTGIPGQIVQINPGSDFNIIYPTPMPADMIQAPWRLLDMQRRILGFPESRVGGGSNRNVSSEMTETEISASMGPTRLRAKLLYYTVQRLAEMIFARMASNYMTERVIPAVEGESFKPVTWHPLDRPERYSVYVDPASFQVMSRTMLKRLGLALYRLKAIDRKSLLESMGWPDWEEVSKRIDDAEAASAKAEMQKEMLIHGPKPGKYAAMPAAPGAQPQQ